MNCIRLERMAPSPDFTSCVSRNSSQGWSVSSAGSTRTAPCRSRLAFCFEEHVGHGEHQRVAGVHEHGAGEAGLVERLEGVAGEGDAVVALEDRLLLAAIAAGEPAVPFADRGGNVGDLEALGLAPVDRAAELVERLQEERADEERLEAPGLGPFHLLFHLEEPIGRSSFPGPGRCG